MVAKRTARLSAGAAALAAIMAAGLTVALTSSAPQASAIVMQSSSGTSAREAVRYDARVLLLVNRRRAAHGLPAVKASPCVTTFARTWSGRLVRRNDFAHSNLGQLLRNCHANYASENIAMFWYGARPRDLVRMWMQSPGHRANILARRARLSGVSVRWDPDRHAWIAVQNFIRK